jgi:hypothetical protein
MTYNLWFILNIITMDMENNIYYEFLSICEVSNEHIGTNQVL